MFLKKKKIVVTLQLNRKFCLDKLYADITGTNHFPSLKEKEGGWFLFF